MKTVLENEFGFPITSVELLNGYDNQNYKVSTADSEYIFKSYRYNSELHAIINAENSTLLYLADKLAGKIPRIIPFADQQNSKLVSENGTQKIYRMLSYLEGDFLGDVAPSKKLMQSLGAFMARLDQELSTFSNDTLKARQWEWDLQYFDLNKKYLNAVTNTLDKKVIEYFFLQFEENVRHVMPYLRKQVIHNDANEWNILVKNEEVIGIIDFGDLAHSFLINELAIAITYACYDKEDPLPWATILIESYHKILPLEEIELQVLYYLIAARLCTSLCNSAYAKKIDPANSYASISEVNARQMLHKWLAINPIKAENTFRKAAGFTAITTPAIETIIQRRHQYVSNSLSLSYEHPIHMSRSAFQYMYDTAGNTFLDAYNNIPHVGHSHPKVVKAGQQQLAKLNTNTRYLYDQLADYAEKLRSYFPDSLNKVFFVNSGSAASDLAIRMALYHTKAKQLMVMESGYHGNTQTAIEISDYKFNNPKGEGQKNHILKTPLPNTYQGKYAEVKNAGELYGKDAVQQISKASEPIAAFICEPVVGCAGQIPLAEGYLKEVYPAIRSQGGVCISDEVQTGFGRLGDYFWGYEAQGVIPDMVILGKPIANGHPMGAVVCTQEIANSFEKGVEFFSSFGGNPVSCAIATAVLEVIEEENLQQNAKKVGEYYQNQLKQLAKKHKCLGDVRGYGLFIGIEIVQIGTKNPDTALAKHLKNQMRKSHILLSTDGPFDNVIKSKPPLCFSKENVDTVVSNLERILEALPST
ncbi:aminotransferase [Croceivirga lutea]|uniref:aminotransferase class III-fold pyridoxal phosphate-dependent enzyme n=1 Tax=Croceivirga lutea TaxID=1775167 RepID=UPI00163A732E|nr:aminotransferase class III-fold pyridoxal phosphate-dependent enzyme [Croceivirga lutea]GGG45112.1 aminotransferase [Croceivirga lutea]